jgi:fucose 4-O-acetylase-like acetyltransferase
MGERVAYLDQARGVAMICIVMLHLTIFNLKGTASESVGGFCHSFDTRLLFLLSGMTAAISMGNKKMGFRECVVLGLKKLRTLFMPFMVWSVIVMSFIFNRSDVGQLSHLLLQAIDPKTGGYWFLLYLFVFQLLLIGIRFVVSLLSERIPNELWREILVAFVASWLIFPLYEYLLIFLVGYFVQKYGQRFLFNEVYTCVAFMLFILLYAYAGEWKNYSLVRVIIALSASSVILSVLKRASLSDGRHFLDDLGRHSLEIYLIHYCLVAMVKDYVISTDHLYAIPLFFMLGGVAMIICWLCCKIADALENIPYVSFVLLGKR